MTFQLKAPDGRFTISVKTPDRRDVFVRRGYTEVTEEAPKRPPRKAAEA